MFSNKTILITGGAGFIGSNIAFYIQKNAPDAKIVIFDKFRNNQTMLNGNLLSLGHYQNLIGFNGEVIAGDLNNIEDIARLKEYKFDYIFHQAAISDTRCYDQELIMRTNVNSFYDLLEIAKKDNAVMVYASSAATYGSSPSPQKIGNEAPENPYGYSKYVMDKIAINFSNQNPNLKIIGLRFFNVYGDREYFKGKTASMVIQLGHQLLSNKEPKLFIGSNEIMRDFIHIDDIVAANILACNDDAINGVYNVGYGKSRSFKDIVDILQSELGTNLAIDYFPNPYSGYQLDTCADISLTKKNLGYTPKINLEKGIAKSLPYIKQTFNMEK